MSAKTQSLGALLALLPAVAPAQDILFSDSFDRADARNIDASLTGIVDATGSSLAADGAYGQPFVDAANDTSGPDGNAANGGGAQILGGKLELADGAGTSNAYVRHNFINPEILAAGCFSVSVEISGATQSGTGQGGGFAIGMSEAEALDTGDAFNGDGSSDDLRRMTDAFGDPADSMAVSDFWVVLQADGQLVWGGIGDQPAFGSTDVGTKTGTVSAIFSLSDFNDGSSVGFEVFFDGASVGTGTFPWTGTDANFIGLDARDSGGVFFDNLSVGIPQPVVTLDCNPTTVAPGNPAKTISLSWSASLLPAGSTYAITADQAVSFPGGGQSGPATETGTVDAVVNGTLGDTTFTIEILDGASPVASAQATVFQKRPNVLLIMLDDMGWSDFGCYGSEIRTPTIDSLAVNGLRYRNFYNTARCSTTRCALLSGLYTQQVAANPGASLPNLITDNNVTIAELLSTTGYRRYMAGKWHLGTSADRSPIGRGFQHIFGQTSGGSFPHNQVSGGNHDSFWDPSNFGFYSENDEVPEIDWTGTTFHQTVGIGDYSVDFIDHHLGKNDGAPFFLYMPFNAVHWDINAPAEMADRYTDVADLSPDGLTADGGDDGGDYYHYEIGWDQVRADRFARQQSLGVRDPSWVLSPKSPAINSNGTASPLPPLTDIPDWSTLDADRQADLARRMAVYAAMLEQVDDNIRKVTDHLSANGLLDNTIIFILADNGGNYEGGLYGKTDGVSNADPVTGTANLRNMGQASNPDLHIGGGWANVNNTPFRLYKHYQHEGGIRTPCIVHWPDGITSPGRWIEDRGHLIDIMATIADVTDTAYPASWPGRTLLPLEGESLKPHFDPATAASFPARGIGFEHEANRAWFKGNYKFVTKNFAYPDGSSPQDEFELYDMSVDPTELNNLALSEMDLLLEMIDDWNAWATHVGVVADRLIDPPGPQVNPAPLPTDLFLDTFNRASNSDHDASAEGMSGLRVPPIGAGAAWWDAFEGGSTEVNNFALRMAVGSGMTETAVQHNFVDPEILAAGGFSVQVRVDEILSSDASGPADRYAGIAVGLTASEAQDSRDIGNAGPPYSFRGSVANPVGTADFLVDLDIDGNLKCWSNGALLDTVPVGQTTGNLLVCYQLASFAAGSPVTVSVFLDGRLIDIDSGSPAVSRSFVWDAADTNHIGLSARASDRVVLDNFAVRTLPLSASLASEYALANGLTDGGSASGADPDGDGDDNFTEWLKQGDPTGSDAGSKLLSISPSASGEFRFSYVHVNEADLAGLTYRFRYSTDLVGPVSSWPVFTPDEVSSEALGETHERRLAAVPAGLVTANDRLFILVEVE
ncbi:hypothetical protein HAHE_16410 [Haloferula helveola]|uniref:Sulfatase N-terminal domain-containing protein n=1 Tax=Haloferula helveola TaxID=490095 RepID=A0ABN6H2D1_9BACT|nr:hypothetical protein HAHE_16410 [Haloferula helveola]